MKSEVQLALSTGASRGIGRGKAIAILWTQGKPILDYQAVQVGIEITCSQTTVTGAMPCSGKQ